MAENRELALVLRLVADDFQNELKKSGGLLGDFQKIISDWRTQLTAVLTVLYTVTKSTANFGEEALKGAQKAGQTVETFTALSYAAKLADVEQQQLIVGLKSLSQNMVEASRHTGDGEAVFRRLGVSATDATGKLRPTEQVLLDLADVFARSADGAGKTEAAVKLFGKAGIDLIPFLNQGKAGISALMDEATRLGVVLSKEDAEAANRFNDEIKKLDAALRGLTMQLGKELIPAFTWLMQTMTDLVAGPVGTLFKLEIQGWHFFFTLLREAIGEVRIELETFLNKIGKSDAVKKFWDDVAIQSRKDLAASNFKKLEEIFFPKAPAPPSAGVEKPPLPQTGGPLLSKRELEEIEERTRVRLGFEDEMTTASRERLRNLIETEAAQKRLDDAQGNIQRARGVAERDFDLAQRAQRANERAGLQENLQAWLAYQDQVGGSTELRYAHEMDLLRVNLAQQLDLTEREAERLVLAWQLNDQEIADHALSRTALTEQQRETLMLQTLTKIAQAQERTSDDVFAGWSAGLRRYIQDQQSMFGLGADMARRFFQTMEQFSQRFFFDALEGRINGTKALFASLLNFAKQITSQIAGQLLVKQIGSAFVAGFPGVFGAGGGEAAFTSSFAASGTGFAHGGSFTVPGSGGPDSMPVGFWATPGETVSIAKPGPSDGGGVNVVVNNYGNNDVQTSSRMGPDGKRALYITIRDVVRGMVDGGELNGAMVRQYGVNAQPFSR